MMQQLLQGQQIQEKALNQVTTDINSRMNHMFNDLSTKYDNVASHMRHMDVQIAQIAESVKRQQGTLHGKTEKNPKECNVVALRSGRNLPDTIPKKLSAAEKGKQKEGEQPRSEALPLSDEEPEQTDPTPVTPPVEHVPPREYTPKVPYPVPAKTSRKDREETKCKKMLKDITINLPLVDAIQMIPSMHSLMKGLISGKVTGDSELLMVSKECNVNSQGQNSGYQKPYQGRTYVLSQANHNQFQNQKHQTAQPTTPSPTTASQDEKREPEQSAETDPNNVAPPFEHVPPCEYTPKVPYPVPAKMSRKDREETKCKKMLEDLTIKLTLVDALQIIPSMHSLMKGLISGKVSGDSELLMVSKECNAKAAAHSSGMFLVVWPLHLPDSGQGVVDFSSDLSWPLHLAAGTVGNSSYEPKSPFLSLNHLQKFQIHQIASPSPNSISIT
ncbi:hypothetical protein F2Q70_00014764 [Brassica cretica]|uniref:Uncharacterized protein n=1 Tax=Brassica cretica TaxID=69181 RepID=A0A8S9HX29_BRACR|nr:hypothetical protein F2Q70_00014764 [Brassica cretica]